MYRFRRGHCDSTLQRTRYLHRFGHSAHGNLRFVTETAERDRARGCHAASPERTDSM